MAYRLTSEAQKDKQIKGEVRNMQSFGFLAVVSWKGETARPVFQNLQPVSGDIGLVSTMATYSGRGWLEIPRGQSAYIAVCETG